jgi:peptide/nickel transport system substrate-binding protein
VIWSFNRMIDPQFNSPVRATLGIIEKIEAPDPLTAVFRLSAAEADFPLLLADYRAMIMPDGTTAEMAAKTPVGTGPYKAEKLDAEATTRLVRNDAYWKGKPALDAIDVIAVPDSSARVQAMLAGDVDFVSYIDQQQEATLATNPRIVLQRIPSGDWNAVTFQTDVAPFTDVRVRRALRIAVDRAAMGKLVVGDGRFVVACDTPLWSGDPYRWNTECPQDIAGAKALLAEAGYPNGIDVELYTSDVEEGMVQMAEVYQAQVAPAGIRVSIKLTPADGFWDNVWLKVPAFIDSWGQRPATQVLNEVWRSGAAWNATRWTRPDFDKILDAARAEPDFEKRKALYGQAQALLWQEGGAMIPYHKMILRAMSDKVTGIDAGWAGDLPWWQVGLR